MTDSLAEALPLEIARVTEIKGHFEECRGLPNVIVEPQIAMIKASIEAAIRACAEGDVVAMVAAYADLKEWSE